MNNLLSYCGLVDVIISAVEKDSPVLTSKNSFFVRFHDFYFPLKHFRFLTCREGSVSVEYWCTGATKVAYIKGSPHRDSSKASFEALPRSATAIELGWSNKFEASLLLCWQSAHSSCSSTNE